MAEAQKGRLMRASLPAWRCAVVLLGAILLLGSPHRGAAAGWADQRMAGPFICRADFSLSGYEGLFGELAQVQQDLTRLLAVPSAPEPVELLLFQSKRTYQAYLQLHYPQVPYRRALFIKGSGPGKVFVHRDSFHAKELPIDVRHEGTHALLHASLPMVPLWLDEGLAEYFEVAPDKRVDANPHLAAVVWNLRLNMMPPLIQLEAKRDVTEMSASDYRYSWAWVHFMLHGPPEAHDELVRFLADIRGGTPPGRLSERLERRLPQVEKRLVQHFKTWKSRPKQPVLTKN
jgi:hypothetical protein